MGNLFNSILKIAKTSAMKKLIKQVQVTWWGMPTSNVKLSVADDDNRLFSQKQRIN